MIIIVTRTHDTLKFKLIKRAKDLFLKMKETKHKFTSRTGVQIMRRKFDTQLPQQGRERGKMFLNFFLG